MVISKYLPEIYYTCLAGRIGDKLLTKMIKKEKIIPIFLDNFAGLEEKTQPCFLDLSERM
jgi:hypothetical protein